MGACPKQPKRNPLLVGGLRAYAPYGPQNFWGTSVTAHTVFF